MSIKHMQMVFDAGDLTSAEKSVLLAYCNFTDPRGYCWPGVERISDMTGISERTIKRTRAALTQRGLLSSQRRRVGRGQSITSMTQVNLPRLAELKRAPRQYEDNVPTETPFTVPDQPTCHDDTPVTSEGATMAPGGCHSGPTGGDTMAPNPSVDPLSNPSSSGEPETAPEQEPGPAPKATKRRSPEHIITERLQNTPGGPPTPDEATAVVDLIDTQATASGVQVRSLAAWVTGRGDRELARDLATVRRSTTPDRAVCGLHGAMSGGTCSSCMGDINAGDTEQVRAELKRVGPAARPDLASALGVPTMSPAALHAMDPGALWRQWNRPRSGAMYGVTSREEFEAGVEINI